jgi:hypothetical protein
MIPFYLKTKNYVINLFKFSALSIFKTDILFCKVQILITANYFGPPEYINKIQDINIDRNKYEILLR